MLKKLEDTDAMPYGIQHKNKPMREVPAGYLHWFYYEKGGKEYITRVTSAGQVSDYIRRNMNALKQDDKDLIWD